MKKKPIVVVGPFWQPVVGTLKDELVWEGREDCTAYVQQVKTPQEGVEELKARLKTVSSRPG